jgi:hypothetical protein
VYLDSGIGLGGLYSFPWRSEIIYNKVQIASAYAGISHDKRTPEKKERAT